MAFVPIRIGALRGDQRIAFDAYVPVGEKRVLYLRQGDSFEGERLARLRGKKLKKLFIKEEDEQKYRDYMARNIEAAYNNTGNQSIENRSEIVQGLQQAAAEAVFEDPTSAESYKSAREGSERFAEFLMKEDHAIRSMLAIANADQNIAHHGTTVAGLAVELAKATGYQDTKNLGMLALGGLLHDIGHYLTGQNIARPVAEFNEQELKEYRLHPEAGARKLKDLTHMDQHVIQIVMEHEECVNGSGYPQGLVESKMNPLSVYVQSANMFDRLVTFEKMSPADAVKHMLTNLIGRYPLTHINALKAIVARATMTGKAG